MITFKLWRSLRSTSLIHSHPLFKRTLRLRHRSEDTVWRWDALGIPKWVQQLIRYIFLALVTLLFVFLIYLMVFLILIYIFFSLLFSGAFWGLQWSMGIASMIARENERRRYDLLAVTPTGPWGVDWVVACAYIHADQSFRTRARRFRILLWALVIVIAGMIFLSVIVDTTPSPYALDFLWGGCGVILSGLALHFEYMASLTSAVLIGMLAPTFASRQIEAALVVLALFAGIQMAFFFLVYVALFIVMPELALQYTLQGFPLLAIYALLLVGLICVRDAANFLLWKVTQNRIGKVDETLMWVVPA